jgi:hypothetical protein
MLSSPMRFDFQQVGALPRLAWCVRFRRGNPSARVYHGDWVETNERFFFEGAWNDDFAKGDPAAATACLGSGASLTQDGALFSAPTHMLERLHTARIGEELLVSNSLAFILAQINDSCDPAHKFYHFDLMSNMKGLRKYKGHIKTQNGNTVGLHYHCNLLISPDLSIEVLPKRLPEPFSSFTDYVGFISKLTRDIHTNATAPGRKIKYEPLTTISSGYDSPTCSLFAQEIGCDSAVTFGKARPGYEDDDDSGKEIADFLNLKVTEFDREDYLKMPSFPEAEFLACGAGGEEVVFAPLENILPGKLFFTGYLGDTVWGLNRANVNEELRMRYPGGSSFGEFRLRVGFIHFPLPAIGYIQHPSIYRISSSPEMAPWTLGNDYDRPIPRCLLEKRGIARNLFGNHKMAITQPLWNTERLASFMTEESFSDLTRFAEEIPMFRGKIDGLRFSLMRRLYELNLRVNWKLDSIAQRFGRRIPEQPLISERYSQPLGLTSLAFHWSIGKIIPRYKIPPNLQT